MKEVVKNWSDAYLPRAIERAEFIRDGGTVSCGHSQKWWKAAKEAKHGDVIYCDTCGRFFVKTSALPWINKRTRWYDGRNMKSHALDSNHLDGTFYYPIDPRFQVNENTQSNSS